MNKKILTLSMIAIMILAFGDRNPELDPYYDPDIARAAHYTAFGGYGKGIPHKPLGRTPKPWAERTDPLSDSYYKVMYHGHEAAGNVYGRVGGAYDPYTAALSESERVPSVITGGAARRPKPRYLGGRRLTPQWTRPAVSGSKDPFGGWGGLGEWWGNAVYKYDWYELYK